MLLKKNYKDFEVLDTWFYELYMALNPGKCNFMCSGSNLSLDEIFIYKNFKLKNTNVNEILGVIIDSELKYSCQTFHQGSIQLLPTFMDVLFTLVKQFDQ